MITFLIQSGKHSGKILNLTGDQILVGRDDACQIRLSTPDVSRKHCLMKQDGKSWFIRDLGSQNGTFVNEAEVKEEVPLQPGDNIRIGPMILQYSPAEIPATAASAVKPDKSKTTDADIASWLTEGESDDGSTGDTTIIAVPRKKTADPVPADTASAVDVAAGTKSNVTASYESVADEAAEIIRKHWELVKREETEDDSPAE